MAFALRKQGFDLQPTGKTSKRIEMPKYLDFIRQLPCIVTGRRPVEAAHVSYAEPRLGKLGRGKGSKETDLWTVPLCPEEHQAQHRMEERAYWQQRGIDPCVVALALYAHFPDTERAEFIIRNTERRPLDATWQAGMNREGD